MMTEELCDSKSTLSKLAEPLKVYPQYMQNIRVKDKDAVFADLNVTSALDKVNELIGGEGRALLRKSGTEPVIRIMIESTTEEKCKEYAEMIAKPIIDGGHAQ